MMYQTPLHVFFSCLDCGAVYSAAQNRTPDISFGRFACRWCEKTVHQWASSKYNFTDWTGPLALCASDPKTQITGAQ